MSVCMKVASKNLCVLEVGHGGAHRAAPQPEPSAGPDVGHVERLMPYLRHRATCNLQAVRDNHPADPDCNCGLAAEYDRLTAEEGATQ